MREPNCPLLLVGYLIHELQHYQAKGSERAVWRSPVRTDLWAQLDQAAICRGLEAVKGVTGRWMKGKRVSRDDHPRDD